MTNATTPAQIPTETRLEPALDERRRELERCGFKTVPAMDGVLGTRSKFYWDCLFTKMNTVAVVRRVPHLDEARFDALKKALVEEAANLDDSALPRGFQKGSAVVAVFIADHIDDELKAKIATKRTQGGFAKYFFPVLVDARTGESFYFKETPFVGGVYYAKFRWLAGRLARPGGEDVKEPLSHLGLTMTVLMTAWFAIVVFGRSLLR